ncbi:hypothetical protein OF83DRAFT_1175443 [Amylostereum chailletii]|nr:hypothetical protein OF83DRAFT_1175443 [Amylostereum chailletii]
MASLAIFSGQCHGGESCTADPCMAFFEDPDHPGQCWCGHSSTAHELSANPCPTDGNSHFECVLAPFNPASVCIRCGRQWFSHQGSASQGLASPTTSWSVSLPSPSSSSTSFFSPAPSVIPLPPNPPGAIFHASVPMPSAQAQAWYAPANATPGPSQPPLVQFVFEVIFRTEGMPGTCGYSESETYGFSPTKLRVPPENYHHAYVLRAKELGVGFTWSVSAHSNDLILPSFKPAIERHMSENSFTVLLDSKSPPQPDHASDFDFLECNQRARVGSTAPALFHPVDVNRVFQAAQPRISLFSSFVWEYSKENSGVTASTLATSHTFSMDSDGSILSSLKSNQRPKV